MKKVIESVSDSTDAKDPDKEKKKKEKEDEITILDRVAKVLMGVKNASVTYSLDNGLLLPGYLNKTNLLGMNKGFTSPSIPFIFGVHEYFGESKGQNLPPLRRKGWMVEKQNITTMHTTTKSEQINLRSL